jgi:hypothetical protein
MPNTVFCNHYRAISGNTTCEAGVDYKAFKGKPDRLWPCFSKRGCVHPTSCDKAQYPTEAELEAEDLENKKHWDGISKAREAIVKHLGGPWKRGVAGARGTIDCPVCLVVNALRFSRAGCNGHIHARCSTAGCVSWME